MDVTPVDYSRLTPAEMAAEFRTIARDTTDVFGRLTPVQLNWKPSADKWSVGQCFDHLLRSHAEMWGAIQRALEPSAPRTVWQRLPLWSGLLGRMLIASMSPAATRKFAAPASAVPASSDVPREILQQFADCQQSLAAAMETLRTDEGAVVMVSPFAKFVTYSVIDGYRIIAAHQRRHFDQARRVTQDPRFPSQSSAFRAS
jgi:hypothetical protein